MLSKIIASKAGRHALDLKKEADQAWAQLSAVMANDSTRDKLGRVIEEKHKMMQHPELHKYQVHLEAQNGIGVGQVYDVWDLQDKSLWIK